jgi:ABC-2 type transport system permease protein
MSSAAQRAEQPSAAASPAWRVVSARELRDLWVGGKALHLIFLYTILLGLYAFFLASNVEVNLLPVKEMIQEVAKTAIVVCLLMSMIVAADGITAERERATLETLLLTPASRTQIVLGKYLAAMSLVPAALLITVPTWPCSARRIGLLAGAALALRVGRASSAGLAAMGMLASIWCNNTKISMAVTFALFLLMLLPSEIIRPGKVMTAAEMRKALVFQSINPIDAITKFLGRVLVLDAPPGEHWLLLTTPALIGVVVLVLLFGFAGPASDRRGRKLRALWTGVLRAASPWAPGPAPAPAVCSGAGRRSALGARIVGGAGAAGGRHRPDEREPAEPSPSAAATLRWLGLGASWAPGVGKPSTSPSSTRCCSAAMYWQSHDSAVSLILPKRWSSSSRRSR